MKLDRKTEQGIIDYCKINGLDENEYFNNLVRHAFMEDKYGQKPPMFVRKNKKENIVPDQPSEVEYTLACNFEKDEKPKRKRTASKKVEKTDDAVIAETQTEEKPKQRKRKLTVK